MGAERAALERATALARDPSRVLREVIVPRISAALSRVEGEPPGATCIELSLGAAGAWCFELAARSVTLRDGVCATPQVIVELSKEDFEDLVLGALDPRQAVISGRMSLAGDVALIAQLMPVLEGAFAKAAWG